MDFILFDVKIGNWWLKREDVEDIGNKLQIHTVPIRGEGSIKDAIEFVKGSCNSAWGDFQAEGLVLKPEIDLFARNGKRIITKLKCKDFE